MDTPEKDSFVRAQLLKSQFEAHHAQILLEEAGIASIVVSFHDTALDGLYQSQKGWGELRVPEARLAEAKKILAEGLPDAATANEEEVAAAASQAKPEGVPAAKPGTYRWILWAVVLVAVIWVIFAIWRSSTVDPSKPPNPPQAPPPRATPFGF
jgi:hypothetical protein